HFGQIEGSEANRLLYDWERWAAELMESHLSYPVLAYFRSQHQTQSWLAALTIVLDASVFMIAGMDRLAAHQAHPTLAIPRRAPVMLCQVLDTPPRPPEHDRLPPAEFATLYDSLRTAGIPLAEKQAVEQRLADLRNLYEPFINALSELLLLMR